MAASSIAALSVFAYSVTLADTRAEIDVSVNETLKQFDALNPNHHRVLHTAAGELVFPRVTKGGAGIAGEYGEGALRIDGKIVGYYSVSSASIGLTLGAAEPAFSWQPTHDLISPGMAVNQLRITCRASPCPSRG